MGMLDLTSSLCQNGVKDVVPISASDPVPPQLGLVAYSAECCPGLLVP